MFGPNKLNCASPCQMWGDWSPVHSGGLDAPDSGELYTDKLTIGREDFKSLTVAMLPILKAKVRNRQRGGQA